MSTPLSWQGRARSRRRSHPNRDPLYAVARKRRAQRARKRIPGRVIFWLIVIFAGELIVAANRSPAVAVRHIRVHGIAGLPAPEQQAVVEAMRITPRTSVLRFPTKRLETQAKLLPCTKEVRISRRLPDTVDVRIVARQPDAIVVCPTGSWEVAGDGMVLRPLRAGITACSIMCSDGIAASPGHMITDALVRSAVDIAASRKHPQAFALANIAVDRYRDICLNTKDGVAIRLGSSDEMGTKLALLDRVYAREPHIGERVSSIDLQCPSAPACTPRPAGNGAPATTAAVASDADSGDSVASNDTVEAGRTHSRRRH